MILILVWLIISQLFLLDHQTDHYLFPLQAGPKSKNIFKLKMKKYDEGGESIDPRGWYKLDKKVHGANFPKGVDEIWYRIDDSTAPSIKIKLSEDGSELNSEIMKKSICQHGFRSKKEKVEGQDKKREISADKVCSDFFDDEVKSLKAGETFVYKGASYKVPMKEAFETATLDKEQ